MMFMLSTLRNRMRVQCPCGNLLKDSGNPKPQFAEFIPSLEMDDFANMIEKAIGRNDSFSATMNEISKAFRFFRHMCQCEICGRLFIEDTNYECYSFEPTLPDCPKTLLDKCDSEPLPQEQNFINRSQLFKKPNRER